MATPHPGVCHGLDYNEIYIIAMFTLTNDYTKTIPTFISIKDYVDLAADRLVSGNVPDNNSFFTSFTKTASDT